MADDKRMNVTLQQNLITILCHSDEFGGQVARTLNADMMEGDYRSIAIKAIDYWTKYDKAPGKHTVDLVVDMLENQDDRKAKTFQDILTGMEILAEGINTAFVLEQVRQFTRVQRLKDAILKSAERLNSAQELAISEVEDIWYDLLRQNDAAFDPGMILNDVDRLLEFMETHYSEFITGIPQLDRRSIVPTRGAVMLMLAPTGRGKSWWLVHLGRHALMSRKKVLHISLEMPEEEVVMRYYQSLWSMAKRKRTLMITTLDVDKDHDQDELDNAAIRRKLRAMDREEIQPEWTFKTSGIREELIQHMGQRGQLFENVRIKRFPPRQLTMNELRGYLDMLHQTENFVPDLLCLDYIGITKTDMKEHRLSIGRNMEDFRAIMIERNIAGATVAQVGRAGMQSENVRGIHAAEDISLINTSDTAITYSSTHHEHGLGLARLFVDKCRNEEDKFGVLITQNYAMGQFALESMLLPKEYTALLREMGEEEEGEEGEEGERRPAKGKGEPGESFRPRDRGKGWQE